jgi:hypothetical protein
MVKMEEAVAPEPKVAKGAILGRELVAGSNAVPIRGEPSLEAAETASVAPGERVRVLEERGDWLRVVYNGAEGWAARRREDEVFLQSVGVESSSGDLVEVPMGPAQAVTSRGSNPMYECTRGATLTADESGDAGAILLPYSTLEGQGHRLLSVLAEGAEGGGVGYAKMCLTTILNAWPAGEAIPLKLFGGAKQFLRYVVMTYEDCQAEAVRR